MATGEKAFEAMYKEEEEEEAPPKVGVGAGEGSEVLARRGVTGEARGS